MHICDQCEKGQFERFIKPEHTEDLGGVKVKILNAVVVLRCVECNAEQTAIPDMQGLVRTAALARALIPVCLSGIELRFIRRALDMTQKQFAQKMELAVETLSRWENDVPGTGGMSEKLLRHNVCALLHKEIQEVDYDPSVITSMRLHCLPKGEILPPIIMERVRIKQCSRKYDAWDHVQYAA